MKQLAIILILFTCCKENMYVETREEHWFTSEGNTEIRISKKFSSTCKVGEFEYGPLGNYKYKTIGCSKDE